jgi:hypothetical protein
MVLIGMTIWFAARQIVAEAETRVLPATSAARALIKFGPIVLARPIRESAVFWFD